MEKMTAYTKLLIETAARRALQYQRMGWAQEKILETLKRELSYIGKKEVASRR